MVGLIFKFEIQAVSRMRACLVLRVAPQGVVFADSVESGRAYSVVAIGGGFIGKTGCIAAKNRCE